MVWNVEIIEVGGKFIVSTVYNADIKDMEFESEGFARLYGRSQRVQAGRSSFISGCLLFDREFFQQRMDFVATQPGRVESA